jgi:dsRNA-specific ribonuclease
LNPQNRILADCFEALLGAIYLDQGIRVCREFYMKILFSEHETDFANFWMNPPPDSTEGGMDDEELRSTATQQKLLTLEEDLGITFTNRRLLIRCNDDIINSNI